MGELIFALVGQALLELNRDFGLYSTELFRDWVMGLVNGVIPFDFCFWGSAALEDGNIIDYADWHQGFSLHPLKDVGNTQGVLQHISQIDG